MACAIVSRPERDLAPAAAGRVPGGRAAWTLTREALHCLLERLDPDPASAEAAYEGWLSRLTEFFGLRGVVHAEAAADETLDRVARRLGDGQRVGHLRGYMYGVARHVLQERLRGQLRERDVAVAWTDWRDTADALAAGAERRAAACNRGLTALDQPERRLIVAYYAASGPARSHRRRALARRLGLSECALRTRAHRLRARLQRSVRTDPLDALGGVGG